MTKRYYISRRIGEGTRESPYTSELRNYIYANWPDEPHFIKQVIAHVIPWCVHKYDLSQEAHDDVMASLTGIFAFPSGALSKTMAEIPAARREAIRNKLESIGFDFSWATASTTVREILEYLFQSIQLAEWADVQITSQNFDLTKGVRDVPSAKRTLISQHLQDLGVSTDGITLDTTLSEVVRRVQTTDGVNPRLFGKLKRKRYLYHDEDTE